MKTLPIIGCPYGWLLVSSKSCGFCAGMLRFAPRGRGRLLPPVISKYDVFTHTNSGTGTNNKTASGLHYEAIPTTGVRPFYARPELSGGGGGARITLSAYPSPPMGPNLAWAGSPSQGTPQARPSWGGEGHLARVPCPSSPGPNQTGCTLPHLL